MESKARGAPPAIQAKHEDRRHARRSGPPVPLDLFEHLRELLLLRCAHFRRLAFDRGRELVAVVLGCLVLAERVLEDEHARLARAHGTFFVPQATICWI